MYKIDNILKFYPIVEKSWLPFFIFALVGLIIFLLICLFNKGYFWDNVKKYWSNVLTFYLGLCALAFTIFSFVAPNFFTGSWYTWDLNSSANISNTVNGLMSPFIAVSAAILTFMAFWVQYNANQNIHKENKKEQVERQFYEMLKIHREMVKDFDFDHVGAGEQVKIHYDVGLGNLPILRKIYEINGQKQNVTIVKCRGQRAVYWYLRELMFAYECLKDESGKIEENFKKAYNLFFEGLKECDLSENEKKKIRYIQNAIHWQNEEFIKSALYKKYGFPQRTIFEGHRSNFNPYYRHLYLIVRKIVKDDIFTEDERMAYLGMLRAQMTSEEQMLLFYNWYSGYGYQWEEKEGNRFFSKYKMIHNIESKYWKFLGINFFDKFSWVSDKEKIGMLEFVEQEKKREKKEKK